MSKLPVVELRNVVKAFGTHRVLDGAQLEIYPGEVMTIIGKSGVGKSVLLKHVIGLLVPDEGGVYYEGRRRQDMSRAELRALKARFSYMFQNNALFDSMTVYENVALPLRETARLSEAVIRERVRAKMEPLELEGVMDRYPGQVSGGMQKRVALARALVTEPEIVLFDEPTTGLDPIRKNAVLSMIARYQQRFRFTAVLVSHDIPAVFYISDRVAILDEGRIVFKSSPLDLEQIREPVAMSYLNHLEALEDDLIGVENRMALEVYWKEASGEGVGGTLVLFRIEDLERVEEYVGHITSRRIVQTLVRTARRSLGEAGRAARYSRNEIVFLLPGVSPDEAEGRCVHAGDEMRQERVFQPEHYFGPCQHFMISFATQRLTGDRSLTDQVDAARAIRKNLLHLRCDSQSTVV